MKMLLVNERRAERRSVIMNCQVVRKRRPQVVGTRAIDLSTDGMLVLINVPVLTGEEVLVSFEIPGTHERLEVPATVARTLHARRLGDPGRGIGLCFEPLDSASNRKLRYALRRYPPTFPRRAPRVDYAATASMIALS